MKQGRTRQRHHNGQTKTPPVIYLPPPQLPPIFKPHKEPEALRAFTLPKSPEVLVEAPPPKKPKRKTQRKTAKSSGKATARKTAPRKAATKKRTPKAEASATTTPPSTRAKAARKKQQEPMAAPHQTAPVSYPVTYNNDPSPLPRNRSLAMPRQGALMMVGKWLRKMIMKRRTPPAQVSNATAITEISSLRDEVVRLQATLEQLLERSKSPPR